jgi:pimeloyl-ACP methyl ester carboxylesterase
MGRLTALAVRPGWLTRSEKFPCRARLTGLMQLHFEEWGDGSRVAVLLHGFMGSAEDWWRVGSALADQGFQVLALDLPGHGLRSADHELTVERAGAHIAETVAAHTARVDLAIGHSFGGLHLSQSLRALAAAAAGLRRQPVLGHRRPGRSGVPCL